MRVVVIDYKMSNMFSIKNALDFLGYDCRITADPKVILEADGAVFPGVGAFPEAMHHLHDLKLAEVIKVFVSSGKPFMGICLGLQLLFTKSDEFQDCEGLNLIDGTVEHLSKFVNGLSVPHVGWNTVIATKAENQSRSMHFTAGINDQESYYFVHSHFVNPKNQDHICTTTDYGGLRFCSSVSVNNIFACQFHPEKSGPRGLQLLKNFFNKRS